MLPRYGIAEHLRFRRDSPHHCAQQRYPQPFLAATLYQFCSRISDELQLDRMAKRLRIAGDEQWLLRGHRPDRPRSRAALLSLAQAVKRKNAAKQWKTGNVSTEIRKVKRRSELTPL